MAQRSAIVKNWETVKDLIGAELLLTVIENEIKWLKMTQVKKTS